MSMTLEQAIEHAEEVADEKLKNAEFIKNNTYGDKSKIQGCVECAAEHRQLADWLRELKERREADNKKGEPMDKAKAIDLLDNLIGFIEDNQGNDYDTAFKMAIKALEAEPCGDAVSRQAAIDALCSKCTVDKPETCSTIQKGDKWCEEVFILQNLPSALNNQVNLCDSCTYTYPECPSEKDDVIFGNGIGNDNICACNKYHPTV